MRELNESEVKVLAGMAGVNVTEEDLPGLAVRLSGIIEIFQKLESLPLNGVEPIPTLLTQREVSHGGE
jgi:Asp-tRNA(Asn)/Glu-tRNA(Gln) amidotransferase C subunit